MYPVSAEQGSPVGIHVNDAAFSGASRQILLVISRRLLLCDLLCHRLHARVHRKCVLVDHLREVRKSDRCDVIAGKRHPVHLKAEIAGLREVYPAYLIVGKRQSLYPPDGPRQSDRLYVVLIKRIRHTRDHARRKIHLRQAVVRERALMDYEISPAGYILRDGVSVRNKHPLREFDGCQEHSVERAVAYSDYSLSVRGPGRYHKIRVSVRANDIAGLRIIYRIELFKS